MAKEIPVYFFRGFLESGKTTFIKNTLEDPYFATGERTLLIACEDGEEEYDEKKLAASNTKLVMVSEQEELTLKFLNQLQKEYRPERVLIEYNGMWMMGDTMMLAAPDSWVFVQTVTTIDATTFQAYMANMGGLMVEQFAEADLVIFNRCNETTKKSSLRSVIKANNRGVQIGYEAAPDADFDEEAEDLPFDFTADIIDISDDDYGLWYIDAMENVDKYVGKTVRFLANIYKGPKLKSNQFVPGRHCMTCCVEDIRFVGFVCEGEEAAKLKKRDWAYVTAKVDKEYIPAYKEEGPILRAVKVEMAKPPEEKVVYFN